MKLGSPLISIVTPSYNQGEYINDTIKSVISQNYKYIEYIIMDGGSSDSTINIIKKNEQKITYWESIKDKGQADAINKGWMMAKGEILCYLNSDDYLAEDCLDIIVDNYNKNPKAKIFLGKCAAIDIQGNIKDVKDPYGYTYNSLLGGRSLGQPSVFIKREIFQQIGPLNTKLHWCLDWAYFLKVLHHYNNRQEIVYINKIISYSREYQGTKSTTGLKNKGDERRVVLLKNFKTWLKLSPPQKSRAFAATYIVQSLDQFKNGKFLQSIISLFRGLIISPKFFIYKVFHKNSAC
jgi:glycosyltransferase involved in cell wall biosynthesis